MQAASPGQRGEPSARGAATRLRRDEIVLLGLVVLSIAGIGVTDYSHQYGLRYWLAMVPIFAATSIWAGWERARADGAGRWRILRTQLLHWLALVFAVYLVYVLQASGRLSDEDAGIVALLVLALTTFLAGVHADWRFCILGLVLGATAGAAAYVQQFFWVLLVVALLGGAVMVLWRRWARG